MRRTWPLGSDRDEDAGARGGTRHTLAALALCALSGTGCAEPADGNGDMLPRPGPNVASLTIQRTGAGAGRVVSSPAGIDCGSVCTATFPPGTKVTLSIEPARGSVLDAWSGACAGTERSCTVTLGATGEKTVTASVSAPARVCSPLIGAAAESEAVCWESPRPTGGTLRAVRALSATDVWALDTAGHLLHFDGQAWSQRAVPTTQRLNALWAGSATEVWAVGDGGTVLRYGGSDWQALPSGTIQNLLGVWGPAAGSGRVWVVGSLGVARLWDGAQWVDTNPGVGAAYLTSVSGTSAGAAWAVTDSGLAVRWSGTAWSRVTSTATSLRAVWTAPSGRAYLVGSGGQAFTAGPTDTALQPVSIAADVGGVVTDDFYDVTGTDDSELWIAGARTYHRTGGRWQREASLTEPLYAAHRAPSGPVFLVGARGAVYTFDGTAAARQPGTSLGLPAGLPWGPIAGRTVTGVWSAAASGASVSLARFDGNRFQVVTPLNTSLRWPAPTSLAAAAETDVWVAGGAPSLLHFDGQQLVEVSASARTLYAVWASGPADVWAVGAQGTAVHYDGAPVAARA